MMRIRLAVPDAAVSPEILDSALEAVTRTNEYLIRQGKVPTAARAIAAGVKWRPEPPGDEHFDMASTVVKRGHGDCDDLAPYHAASLRITGEDPDARATVIKSGKDRWHAVVERSDGTIDDPSAAAGMYEYRAPLQPRLSKPWNMPHVATKKVGAVWCARCDVPWRASSHALSSHAMHTSQRGAIASAIDGAVACGELAGVIEDEHALKLATLEALMHGVHPERIVAGLEDAGVPNVGSFFSKLIKTAAHLAPIPGVSQAYDLASGAADALKGGGGGHAAPGAPGAPIGPTIGPPKRRRARHGGGGVVMPQGPQSGPIIVRF